MRERHHSGGVRQAIWSALMAARAPFESAKHLALAIDSPDGSVRPYVLALKKRGYIKEGADGSIELVRRTGPRAPSYSVHTDDFRDWNLAPAMAGAELKAAIAGTGLSLPNWLASHDMSRNGTTRLRQMIRGQRPISSPIEQAARKDLARLTE